MPGGVVNYELSLTLELLEHTAEKLRFQLRILNQSGVKLLVPCPEIHGLRFHNKATQQEAEWYTRLLVSSDWVGFTLDSRKARSIEYPVRPYCVAPPARDDGTDYFRWSVALPDGEYLVWFQFRVGEDYFCCDSHYRFHDLQHEAESQVSIVWTGETKSNLLDLARATPADT
jgi:hypothetical protein